MSRNGKYMAKIRIPKAIWMVLEAKSTAIITTKATNINTPIPITISINRIY